MALVTFWLALTSALASLFFIGAATEGFFLLSGCYGSGEELSNRPDPLPSGLKADSFCDVVGNKF